MSSKKITLPVVLVIICGVVMLGLVVAYLVKFGNKDKVPNTAVLKELNLSEATFNWLKDQKDGQGLYLLGTRCNEQNQECAGERLIEGENKDGLIVTWARFKNYQKNKDKTDLDLINQDIEAYFKRYQTGDVSGLWTCKIMYEMWQSDVFDEATKAKMKTICEDNQYLPVDKIGSFYDDQAKVLLDLGKNVVENGESLDIEKYNEILSRGFGGYTGISSDYVARYLWNKDENDLKIAEDYFEKSKANYPHKMLITSNDVCILGISALDLYQIDQDKSKLDLAQKFFDEGINSNIQTLEKMYVTPMCSLFLKEFYQLTQDQKYLAKIEENNNEAATTYWSSNNKGFFKISDNKDEPIVYSKNVVENAILLIDLSL